MPFGRPSQAYAEGWFSTITFVMVISRIALAFVVLSMAKQRQGMQQRIHAMTDRLTGLPNRRAFYESLASLESKRSLQGVPISVLCFDLDHFKDINDTLGHETGDQVLKVFAETAAAHVEAHGVIARMGGEEFAALLPGTDAKSAVVIAEELRASFAKAAECCGGNQVGATVSVGVAASVAAAHDTSDLGALIRQADAALYAAKRAGRNRVKLLEPEDVVLLPAGGTATPAAA